MSAPTYDQFVQHESHQIKAAYDQKNARERLGNHMNEGDLAHCLWRRLVEHWTLRDVLHDILGEPLEDGGADGDGKPQAEASRLPRGFLRTQGADFVTEDGQPWLFAGYSAHTLIGEIAAGRDIGPLLDKAIGYGANTIITIGCHLSPWKKDHGFYYDPRQAAYQGHLAALFDQCASKGLRVAYAVLADGQGLSTSEQQGIWRRAQDVARGRWNVLLRIGNEGPENNWRPDDFSRADLGGVLQSKGSAGGDTVPYLPAWDFAEYESRRDLPKALLDANCLELAFGGWDANPRGIRNVPIVNIEPVFFHDTEIDQYGDRRWTDPVLAYRLGLQIGSGCAGGGFGASDGLVCRPLQPRAAECARRFFAGLRAGFMR